MFPRKKGWRPHCGCKQQYPPVNKKTEILRSPHFQILIRISMLRKRISHLVKCSLLEKHTHLAPTLSPSFSPLFLAKSPPVSLICVSRFFNLTSRSSLATSLSSLRMPSSWSITIFMWLRMRSLGLGVSEVSRAGALLRDILYRATWGQWPTGWGRGGAESGSMSLATWSLSATDPNRGPGRAGRPQHLKSTWAAKAPCLARTLGTGSRSDIHALWSTLPEKRRKIAWEKSNAVNPWKRKRQNTWAKAGMKLLHNHIEPTHLVCHCVRLKLFSRRSYLKTSIQRGDFFPLPLVLHNLFYSWNAVT